MGHLLENLVQFAHVLRGLGLEVPADNTIVAGRAAQWIDIGRKDEFRLALRAVMVRRPEDLQLFDQAFRVYWSRPSGTSTKLDLRPLGSDRKFGNPTVEMESLTAGARDGSSESPAHLERIQIKTYSASETLRQKDFKSLSPEEEAQAIRLLKRLQWRPAPKRTKRWVAGRGTSPDFRGLLTRFAKRDADPSPPPTRARRFAHRNLVLLCDISGSMERYTRMLLWFACCMTGNLTKVESFVFATRLTRITTKLRRHRGGNPLLDIGRLVPDWSGGTCIGDAMRSFNTTWARRVAQNGAVVLVVSDGWDRGDPEVLRTEIARLQRSCHRLIWLTPLLGDPRYEPLTRGLQAALPHVDDFLPVHNLASLDRLAEHLNDLPDEPRHGAAHAWREASRSVC